MVQDKALQEQMDCCEGVTLYERPAGYGWKNSATS
jgi:hypothetical protein